MNPTPVLCTLAASFFMAAASASPMLVPPASAEEIHSAAELQAAVSQLVDSVLADAEGGVTYECNGECKETGDAESCPHASSPRVSLSSMIAKSPEAMEAYRAEAVAAIRTKSNSEKKADALIGVLIDTRSATACGVAEAMHEAAPKRFDSASLLSFCELGSEPLEEALASLAKKGDVDVFAAAYLAVQDNRAGRKVLKKALKAKALEAGNALDVLVAAHGLEHLGQEGALSAAQRRLHDAAVACLDAGDLTNARAMAVTAYVHRAAVATSQPGFSTLRGRCAKTASSFDEKGKLESPEQIFEMLQELTPII